MAKQSPESCPDHNYDVTSDSGYTFEGKVQQRTSNGWGGTQTKLPPGHMARRDAVLRAKVPTEFRKGAK